MKINVKYVWMYVGVLVGYLIGAEQAKQSLLTRLLKLSEEQGEKK